MIQDVSLQFASQSCRVSGRSFSRRSSANEEARLCPRWTSDFGEDTSEWVMGVTRPVENLRALPKNAPSTHHASQGRGEGDYSKPARALMAQGRCVHEKHGSDKRAQFQVGSGPVTG